MPLNNDIESVTSLPPRKQHTIDGCATVYSEIRLASSVVRSGWQVHLGQRTAHAFWKRTLFLCWWMSRRPRLEYSNAEGSIHLL